jgi:phytoene dehydrogenase-like protein
MGGISNALAAAARDMGVEIRCNAEVAKIKVQGGAATGVVLNSGEEFDANKVASGVDPRWTFERFLEPRDLPPDFLAAVTRIGYESASMKINVALAAPPNFTALPSSTVGGVGPQHHGTMHFCPDQDFIERGYDDAKYGVPSRDPIVEMTMPSALDPTVAPPGKHLASMFVQYAPYKLKTGTWDDATKNAFADRCFDIVEQYAPGFKASVLDRQIVSPLDLERTFGLTGGNIFQGAMNLNQLFLFRPVVGYADYRTPVRHLYLCGSAAHPGGGVMGIAGHNAAREMLKKW